MAEAKGKKVSRLPKARKGKGKPSEPKLKKKTVRALNEAYNRRKTKKRKSCGSRWFRWPLESSRRRSPSSRWSRRR